MPRYYQHMMSVSILQRSRGVYLCHFSEDKDGTEDWDAFSTLKAAKYWCAQMLGVKRPQWQESPATPTSWPSWHAYVTFDGDEIEES